MCRAPGLPGVALKSPLRPGSTPSRWLEDAGSQWLPGTRRHLEPLRSARLPPAALLQLRAHWGTAGVRPPVRLRRAGSSRQKTGAQPACLDRRRRLRRQRASPAEPHRSLCEVDCSCRADWARGGWAGRGVSCRRWSLGRLPAAGPWRVAASQR